ncbi:MAG TPA: hypothetical protein VLH08_06815 [Acidobacteriota bacterium]|nr:hypothetical protein [Acidobacteriota bacterium]
MKRATAKTMSKSAVLILILATAARVLVKFLPAIRGFLHVR